MTDKEHWYEENDSVANGLYDKHIRISEEEGGQK